MFDVCHGHILLCVEWSHDNVQNEMWRHFDKATDGTRGSVRIQTLLTTAHGWPQRIVGQFQTLFTMTTQGQLDPLFIGCKDRTRLYFLL